MKVYLEPYEVGGMEEQATCVRDRLLIRILFRLGCRISEALALRVEKALTREQEHRRMRTLPIDGDTLEILRNYICRGGPITRGGRRGAQGVVRETLAQGRLVNTFLLGQGQVR